MSTNSFLHNVVIRTPEQLDRFSNAMDEAQRLAKCGTCQKPKKVKIRKANNSGHKTR